MLVSGGDSCPRCFKGKLERIRRKKWMRFIFTTKHYRCRDCLTRYLTVFHWTIRLGAGQGRKGGDVKLEGEGRKRAKRPVNG